MASATANTLNEAHTNLESGSGEPRLPDPLPPPSSSSGMIDSPGPPGFQPPYVVDDVFDYASFLWDPGVSGDLWPHEGPSHAFDHALLSDPNRVGGTEDALVRADAEATPLGQEHSYGPEAAESEQKLLDYFAQSAAPPILSEVETRKEWLAMRRVVLRVADASQMVRCAILCFSNLLVSRQNRRDQGPGDGGQNGHKYYETAVAQETSAGLALPSPENHSSLREHLLVALFFLSYVDILESRLSAAHSHLQRAYDIFRRARHGSFTPIERQFLLWIRLLDGRAVSAGGEGLFLSEEDDQHQLLNILQASPASFAEGDSSLVDESLTSDEDDIEDVLFQVLYQPGIVFYQRVQNFAGRIARIDPWHRPRGTVEDEIEVMNVGAAVAADLRALYAQRPPLMDIAAAGRLTQPHVSAHLAFVITRAFRTYLSNYYASKVHLHRVAYKSLPLTREAGDALVQIRRLARLLTGDLDADEGSLPVNMLWPLLMLGVEEKDPGEKAWIRTQILRMERVAGNAKITAQVLEEVQARQDAGNERVDIRSVMHAVFNSCFAIL